MVTYVQSVPGCNSYVWYQLTKYFRRFFGTTILSFLQISINAFPPPRKDLVWYFACYSFSVSYLYFHLYLSIVWYSGGNLPLSNLLKQYLSDKCSLLLLLSFTSELINESLLKASSASLSGLFIYFILVRIIPKLGTNVALFLLWNYQMWGFYGLYILLYNVLKELYGTFLGFPLYLIVLVL